MTDPTYTHLALLIDRSGSMDLIRTDTEGGVNTFITEQRNQPGRCTIDIIQFDNHYEQAYSGNINQAPPFVLTPRGSTALLDAMGKFITTTGEKLAEMDEHMRPGKVIVVIATDGYENDSREWTHEQIENLVTQQENDYGWTFLYLGANQDAIKEAAKLGINAGNSMTYDCYTVGAAYTGATQTVSNLRSGQASALPDHASEVTTT